MVLCRKNTFAGQNSRTTLKPKAYPRFPRGIESIEKAFIFKIGFQDLEEVLNLPKMYIRY